MKITDEGLDAKCGAVVFVTTRDVAKSVEKGMTFDMSIHSDMFSHTLDKVQGGKGRVTSA